MVAGGRNPVRWAPATSGFTFVSLNSFYREQTTDDEGGGSTDQVIAGLELAYIAFNKPEWAEFLMRVPTKVAEGIEVYHYARSMRMNCANELLAVR